MTSWDFSAFRVRDLTPAQARWGGVLMVPMGLFVALGGAVIGFLALDLPVPAEWLPAGLRQEPRPPGGGLDAWQAYGLLAMAFLLLSFGATAVAQGSVQIATGRRNRALLRVMLVIVGLVVAAGVAAAAVLGRRIGTGELNG